MLSITSVATAWPPAVASFYEALRTKDARLLLRALDERFVAHASAGMPLGVGGEHRGAAIAVGGLWAVVNGSYDIAPIPSESWTGPDGSVVVHGWYEGEVRRTGKPVRAEFVHLFRMAGGRLGELRQITDTVAWGTP